MPRDINKFNGDALIIGGGWCEKHTSSKPINRNPDNFYTIDINHKAKPDAVLDITNDVECSIIPSNRFNLIYFECFPWIDEESLQKAFNVAQRFLKQDGVLIYRGGSDKSASSIPSMLKKAGFTNAIKKELNPEDPRTQDDNGSISLASNIEIKLLEENFSKLPEITQYFLNRYKFLSLEPFSINPMYSLKKITLDFRANTLTNFSLFQPSKINSTATSFSQKEKNDISNDQTQRFKHFSIRNHNTG